MEAKNTHKQIKISDGTVFRLSNAAAQKFGIIRTMEEDGCAGIDDVISLPVPDRRSFEAAAKWAKRHAGEREENSDDDDDDGDIKSWDKKFAAELDVDALKHALLVADLLDAPELVELLAERTASLMRGKSFLEIRKIFDIKSEFAPGEEEAIIRKNPWAFE